MDQNDTTGTSGTVGRWVGPGVGAVVGETAGRGVADGRSDAAGVGGRRLLAGPVVTSLPAQEIVATAISAATAREAASVAALLR